MRKSLPQANDLDKVIDVMTYIHYHPGCSEADIANFIGFAVRQARYYVDACRYLGLVEKNRYPSVVCEDIFRSNPHNVTERIFERIITDELMGQVFARAFVLPESDLDDYARELVAFYHPEIASSSTFKRRAHIIVLWCNRIINLSNIKHKRYGIFK